MIVLAAVTMGVMMMHVMDSAAFGEVDGNVLLVLEGMLNMGADRRNNGNCLGQQNEAEEKWTKSL